MKAELLRDMDRFEAEYHPKKDYAIKFGERTER